jgi:cytoskeletal protein RodZ
VSVTVVGIGAVIGLMAVMSEVVHFNIGLIVAFSLLVFLAFLGVDSVIVWLLLRPSREAREAYFRTQHAELTTNELADSKARVLAEPSFSVTDHTTHTLEPAERKRQTE